MAGEGRRFFEVFPKLELPENIRELFEQVRVTRVIRNSKKNILKIYISCEDWIKKEHIYETEEEIARQVFPKSGAKVHLLESFSLSSQYDPENFYQVYQSSMQKELESESPLLSLVFRNTRLIFHGPERIEARIPDNFVLRERQQELVRYFETVFVGRAGFTRCEIDVTLVDPDRSALFAEDTEKIKSHVAAIVKRANKKKEEEPKEEKLPTSDRQYRQAKSFVSRDPNVILGRGFDEPPVSMDSLGEDPHEVVVRGEVFSLAEREMKNGKTIFLVALTDHTDSIRMKLWLTPEELPVYRDTFKMGK